jgi:flagellar motor switch protein FliG
MSAKAHKFIEEFFTLPEDDQAEILQAIVPPDDEDPAFIAELERRLKTLDDGTAVLHSHEDVRRHIMETLKR